MDRPWPSFLGHPRSVSVVPSQPSLVIPFPLILHSPRVSPAERAAFGRTRGEWGWGREKDTERNDQRE